MPAAHVHAVDLDVGAFLLADDVAVAGQRRDRDAPAASGVLDVER